MIGIRSPAIVQGEAMIKDVPTLYEWIGGAPALEKLTVAFYAKVKADPLIAPIFAHRDARDPVFGRSAHATSGARPRGCRGADQAAGGRRWGRRLILAAQACCAIAMAQIDFFDCCR
jgi:hypothetical protein